jgi:hypothetical protein
MTAESMAMIHKWTYTYTTDAGYVFGGTLEDGSVRHLKPGLTLDSLTAGSTCIVDPTTDAIIPARFTATNLTKDFPTKVSEGFGLDAFAGIQVEVGYSSGPMCVDGNNSRQVRVASTAAVTAGQPIQVSLFFILAGYYTPTHPTGDPSVLKKAKVYIGSLYELKATGPGLVGAGTSQRIIPLGG